MGLFAKFKKAESVYNPKEIAMPVSGEVIPLETVRDEVFASGAMGKGVGIIPESERVLSPISGTLNVVFPTGHAYGIVGDNGVEILIHIGINTVELQGEGLFIKVKQGQHIKRGEVLCTFDKKLITDKGYDSTIMLIVTNGIEVDMLYGKHDINEAVLIVK